jgi:hypothetical protein
MKMVFWIWVMVIIAGIIAFVYIDYVIASAVSIHQQTNQGGSYENN